MAPETSYYFGPFSMVVSRRDLRRDGVPVALGARPFDLLLALIEGRDRIVPKAELLGRVWPGVAVEENNLTVNMSLLRKALGDGPNGPAYIRTVSGRGYRFVGEVSAQAPTASHLVSAPPAALARPGIAVLPFVNLSDDPAADHFGEGIAEDIIADLSRNRWLTVIARNSSFSFRGVPPDIREVARQFGVRYVLEGSIRKAGARVRVMAHLVDTDTGSSLISERFDRDLSDFFTVQDEITTLITTSVRPVLYEAEQARSFRRRPESLDAWAAYQRGVWHFSRFSHPESLEAQSWFERAIALNPRFAPGYYGLGLVYLHDGSAYLPHAPPDWQSRGEALARQAVALDERDSGAHGILAAALMMRGAHQAALESTATALDLNPNDATAHGTAGATLVFSGQPLAGLAALATCLRLNPRDPRLRVRQAHVGLGHWFAGQYDQAEAMAQKIMHEWPNWSFGPRLHAMVLSETGRLHQARAAIEAAIARDPAPFDDFSLARMPWYGPEAHRQVVAAFKRAGWPEQTTGLRHSCVSDLVQQDPR